MKVRYLFGPRKGEVVDMPSAHAKHAIAERRVEPETPPAFEGGAEGMHEFGDETKAILHGKEAVLSEEDLTDATKRPRGVHK